MKKQTNSFTQLNERWNLFVFNELKNDLVLNFYLSKKTKDMLNDIIIVDSHISTTIDLKIEFEGDFYNVKGSMNGAVIIENEKQQLTLESELEREMVGYLFSNFCTSAKFMFSA